MTERSTESVPHENEREPSLESGALFAGRYRIQSVLGRGASGIVYAAFDTVLERDCALKLLRRERIDSSTAKRFLREAGLTRELSSPNVLRIFDVGEHEGLLFLSMEQIEGGTLAARLVGGPLPWREAAEIGVQVLRGIVALHDNQLVHRDIKPSNILLPESGEAKVADFGLALDLSAETTRLTEHDGPLGTLAYLSPEQALGEAVTARSDLYSLGVVLYEMLTGQLPFATESSLGTVLRRLSDDAPDPRAMAPTTPPWLARLVRRLLEREPSDRYATAEDVLRDLESHKSRFRLQRRQLRTVATGVAVAAILAVSWFFFLRPEPLPTLVPIPGGGIRAIGPRGLELWRDLRFGDSRSYTIARIDRGQRPRVVTVLPPPPDEISGAGTLSVFDIDTGVLLRPIGLPPLGDAFERFSLSYTAQVVGDDVDGDGLDEVFISRLHVPSWPSDVSVYEPTKGAPRSLFQASGHHRYAGAFDLDDDRDKEIIVAGINNEMGWSSSFAALQPMPPIGKRGKNVETRSPDRSLPSQALYWYALAPPGGCPADPETCLEIDRRRRTLTFSTTFSGSEGFVLEFDGFSPSAQRRSNDVRNAVYESLFGARRSLLRGERDDVELAETAVNEALARAHELDDVPLLRWCEQTFGRVLIARGDAPRAEQFFEALAKRSPVSSDVHYEAAVGFHVSGDLTRAASWYERGLRQRTAAGAGRKAWEYLEGLLLALIELEEWEQAAAAVSRFLDSNDASPPYRQYGSYVSWRQGMEVSPLFEKLSTQASDLPRYTLLEVRYRHDGASEELLAEVDFELRRSSRTKPLVRSLRGAVLHDLGRLDEAIQELDDAYTTVSTASEPLLLAHRELVHQRWSRARRLMAANSRESPDASSSDSARSG